MQNIIKLYSRHPDLNQETRAHRVLQSRIVYKKVALPALEGTFLVRWTDILYCKAESNYCWIHRTNGNPILVSKTLKSILAMLPSSAFVRVHQTYLVRLDAIGQVTKNHIALECGTQIPVSRSKRPELMQALKAIINF